MKFKHGLAFPDADQYLFDRLPPEGLWQFDAFDAGVGACEQFRAALDGGAHIGTWSLKLAERFGRVIAFEPSPDTFEALQYNTAETGVEIFRQALGARPDRVKMRMSPRDKRRQHTGARYFTRGGDVEQVTIDSLGLEDLDFLKLDLEGAEVDALQGAVETLKRCRPVVVFEDKGFCAKRYGHVESAARELLAGLGAGEIAKLGINRVWGW